MRYRLFNATKLILLLFVFAPLLVAAQATGVCSTTGYTILTINGIFVNKEKAGDNKRALEDKLPDTYNNENIRVDFLHNASHLGGAGDLIKSIEQGIFDTETVDDYDLTEMLRSASEKVKTRKLLIVAHSQGNFYANGIYDVLTSPLEGGARKRNCGGGTRGRERRGYCCASRCACSG